MQQMQYTVFLGNDVDGRVLINWLRRHAMDISFDLRVVDHNMGEPLKLSFGKRQARENVIRCLKKDGAAQVGKQNPEKGLSIVNLWARLNGDRQAGVLKPLQLDL